MSTKVALCLVGLATNMTFKAHYIHMTIKGAPDYWRTVYADDINEATRIAKQYARKGYRLHTVTSHD